MGRAAIWSERALYAVGAFCFVIVSSLGTGAAMARRASMRLVAKSSQADPPTGTRIDPPTTPGAAVEAEVIGRLEIPGLNLSVPILSDYDPSSLRRGVGHIRGTASAGGLGNFVLAGHRDTFLRPLRNINRKMVIKVSIQQGIYEYITDSTEVVDPTNLNVLDIHNTPELTLITCYPFDFIGSAPRRFIVHAHLASASPVIPS